MPSKALRTSEGDLNRNLASKISVTDLPFGFISKVFILIMTLVYTYINFLVKCSLGGVTDG